MACCLSPTLLLLLLPSAACLQLSSLRASPKPLAISLVDHPPTRTSLVTMSEGNALLDAAYFFACVGALSFAFRNVFDSIFFENDGFRPPMPVFKNPLEEDSDPYAHPSLPPQPHQCKH